MLQFSGGDEPPLVVGHRQKQYMRRCWFILHLDRAAVCPNAQHRQMSLWLCGFFDFDVLHIRGESLTGDK